MNTTHDTHYRYVAEKKGTDHRSWAIYRETVKDDTTYGRMSIAQKLDPMQAHVAVALLNGNEDLHFDNEGQAVIYTGYMRDPKQPQDEVALRFVLFDPETAEHDAT